jgi:hypothetical protein
VKPIHKQAAQHARCAARFMSALVT